MKELELLNKAANPVSKPVPAVSHSPSLEHLRSKTTDELVKLLMNPETARPANATLRQQIIKILQEREGNAFVQRLLGKTTAGKSA